MPAAVYAFPFEPNPDWSAYYASGAEIHQYFKRTVAKYDLARNVKCGHRVEHAEFNEDEGRWHLKIRHRDQVFDDVCDVLVSATGFLSRWRWPSIPGFESFKGHRVHSAQWDLDYDYAGKKIGIIGNGSSAIQIMPQLVKDAAHVTNFVRSPTYITPGLVSGIIGGRTNHVYSEEEKRRFREDPEALKEYRRAIQQETNENFDMVCRGMKRVRGIR